MDAKLEVEKCCFQCLLKPPRWIDTQTQLFYILRITITVGKYQYQAEPVHHNAPPDIMSTQDIRWVP